MNEKDLIICKLEMKIMTLESELRSQTEQAILKEKTKRLEAFIYGSMGMLFLQLIAMFIMWVKDLNRLQ